MKWRVLASLLFLICSLGLAEDRRRVAIVTGLTGKPMVGDRPSRMQPIRPLMSLEEKDVIDVPKGSSLSYSCLNSGRRYRLTGPAHFDMPANGELKATPGVKVEDPQSRSALAASNQVDLDKYGGATSRALARPIMTDSDSLTLRFAHDRSEPIQVQVADPDNAGTPRQDATLLPIEGNLWRLEGAKLEPGHGYFLLNLDNRSPIPFGRLSQAELQPVQRLARQARGVDDYSELLETYIHLRLFVRAQETLDTIARKFPQADVEAQRKRLEDLFDKQLN